MLRLRALLTELQMAQIATILRSTLILYALSEFFIGHSAVFVFDSSHLHFPIPGLATFASPLVLFLLAWITVGSAIFGIVKVNSRSAILIMGLASFAFLLLTTERRLAFSYYVPLSLVAIGIQSFYRSNPRPVFVFIGAVYLIAALHKIASFSEMLNYLPIAMSQIYVGEIATRPEVSWPLGKTLAFTVVIVELAMGSLFLFPRTRLYGFVLVCAFHTILTIVGSERSKLAHVSFSVLVVHAIAASSQIQFRLGELFERRYWPHWMVVLSGAALMLFGQEKGIIPQGAKTLTFLFPLMAIGFAGHVAKHRHNRRVLANSDTAEVPRVALAALAAICIIWALTPKMTGYTNDHLGFAMFSYGSHKQPFYCVDFSSDPAFANCPPKRNWLPVVVRTRRDNNLIQYCSRQSANIERLQEWSRANCPQAASASRYELYADDANGFKFLHQ